VTDFTTEALITTESTEIFINFFSVPSVEISVSVVSLPQFTGTWWFLGSIRLSLTRMPFFAPLRLLRLCGKSEIYAGSENKREKERFFRPCPGLKNTCKRQASLA